MIGTTNQEHRDQWIKSILQAIPAGYKILDAGAGERRYKEYCGHLEYVSQDFAQYDGRGDSAGLQTGSWDNMGIDIVSDITRIPQPDNSFDVVMCTEVFEHLPEPIKALREFSRLLKPAGVLILTAPFSSLTHMPPYYYYTGFSRYFYKRFLEEMGFTIVDMNENGSYFEYLAQEIRRLPYISERYAGKKLGLVEGIEIRSLLSTLGMLSRHDQGSKELLSYGLQVVAVKS